eukprot:gene11984-biopygen10098
MTCTLAPDDIAEWAVKNGCPKDEYTSGRRTSFTIAERLELSVYVKVDEPLQEEEVEEEAEVIVVQEDEVVEDEEVEDEEVAVDQEDDFSLD